MLWKDGLISALHRKVHFCNTALKRKISTKPKQEKRERSSFRAITTRDEGWKKERGGWMIFFSLDAIVRRPLLFLVTPFISVKLVTSGAYC